MMKEEHYHLKVAIDPHFYITGIDKIIVNELGKKELVVIVDNDLNNWSEQFRGLDAPHNYRALITIQLSDKVLKDKQIQFSLSETLPDLVVNFLKNLDESFGQKQKIDEILSKGLRLHPLCVYFLTDSFKVHFTFVLPEKRKEVIAAWEKMMDIFVDVQSQNYSVIDWLDSVPRQKNNMHFLIYDQENLRWEIIDRLLDASSRLSIAYKESINDDRIRKPYILFNEDNYNQYAYFDNQWSLKLDNETIIMPQPNDIALYVRLAEKNLKEAERFYQQENKRRSGKLHMPLLNKEDYLKYYDYFESIIAAITFSYTSIETLANTCIPYDFTYIEEGQGKRKGIKTVYSKEAIELSFPLRDKLKTILPQILQSANPVTEKWWDHFIALEGIRDEIIHTKQSKSEERYSLFLSRRIFEIINCNKTIIKYYGQYINKNVRDLLFDYPYGFGFDSVPASFLTAEEYAKYYNRLHNPWKPLDEGKSDSEL